MSSPRTRRFVRRRRVLRALRCTQAGGSGHTLVRRLVRGTTLYGKLARQRTTILLRYSRPSLVRRVFRLTGRVGRGFCNGHVMVFTPLCLSGCYIGNYACYPCRTGGGAVTHGGLARRRVHRRIVTLRSVKRGHLTLRTKRRPALGPVRCVLRSVQAVYNVGRGGKTVHQIGMGVTTAAMRGCHQLGRTNVNACVLFRRACRGRGCRTLRPAKPGDGCTCRARTVSHTVRKNVSSMKMNILFKLGACHCSFAKLLVRTRRLRTEFNMNPRAVDIPHVYSTSSVSTKSFPGTVSSRVFDGVMTIVQVTIPCAKVVVSAHRSRRSHGGILRLNVSRVDNNSHADIKKCTRERLPRGGSTRFSIDSAQALSRIIG